MALTATQIVGLRRPALIGNARLADMLTLAALDLNEEIYGVDLYPKALALLVLHYYAKDDRGSSGASGPITSETEGSLSRSYAAATGAGGSSPHDWETTTWGQELLALTRTVTCGASMSLQEDD